MKRPRLQVGFDISRKKLDMCILRPDGEVLIGHRSFPNSEKGYQEMKQSVFQALQAEVDSVEGVDLGGESTGYYWLPFFLQLREDGDWKQYEPNLHLLNSRQVHWFKKGFAQDDKTDAKDSYYVAEKMRSRRDKHAWEPEMDWLRLRIYSRQRFHLGQNLTRMKNYFWAHMFIWCNGYGNRRPFSDGLGACGRALMQEYPDWQALRQMKTEDLAEQLATWSKNKLPDPGNHANELQEIIAQSFTPHPKLATALYDLLNLTIDRITLLERQAAQVDRLMRSEIEAHHQEVLHLINIKGIGVAFAAGITSEIGGLERFFRGQKWDKRRKRYRQKNLRDVEDSVAKFAGLWWPRKDSGDFQGVERRLSKQGNRYLRYHLVEAADKLRQHLPEYRAYYQRKYRETKKHQHKRALVLTARKSIGLYVGLLHRNEPYRSPESV